MKGEVHGRAQVLCGWLEGRMAEGAPAALFLPLYFLARARIAEALHAHARLLRSPVPASLDGAAGTPTTGTLGNL